MSVGVFSTPVFFRELQRVLDFFRCNVALEVFFKPVKQTGRDDLIAFFSKIRADLADMIGDAENFLRDHKAADALAFRLEMPCADFIIADFKRDLFCLRHAITPFFLLSLNY